MSDAKSEQIRAYYESLYAAWGPQRWWPAQTPFEVIVGAYLTQNTSWNNVEKAMASLRHARVLSVDGIRRTPLRRLEKLVRSAGYFRQKAMRLKTFVRFLDEHFDGSLRKLFAHPTARLREELLSLNGVGPETADSILLYAANHPVFVVDAYTRRILERHGLISPKASYDEIRELFEDGLGPLATVSGFDPAEEAVGPRDSCHTPSRMSEMKRPALVQIFNEMHGLLVGVGKNYCQKSQMRCEQCPLQKFLPGKS